MKQISEAERWCYVAPANGSVSRILRLKNYKFRVVFDNERRFETNNEVYLHKNNELLKALKGNDLAFGKSTKTFRRFEMPEDMSLLDEDKCWEAYVLLDSLTKHYCEACSLETINYNAKEQFFHQISTDAVEFLNDSVAVKVDNFKKEVLL